MSAVLRGFSAELTVDAVVEQPGVAGTPDVTGLGRSTEAVGLDDRGRRATQDLLVAVTGGVGGRSGGVVLAAGGALGLLVGGHLLSGKVWYPRGTRTQICYPKGA